jgi:hypothetical protein
MCSILNCGNQHDGPFCIYITDEGQIRDCDVMLCVSHREEYERTNDKIGALFDINCFKRKDIF